MSNNLRSVLGMPRVQKKKKMSKTTSSNHQSFSSSASSTISPSWTSSLARTKPLNTSVGSGEKISSQPSQNQPATAQRPTTLQEQTTFDDVAQAQKYTLSLMFDPIPDRGSGMNSVKISQVLNTRQAIPRLNSTAHLQQALLLGRGWKGKNCSKSPTAAERELADAIGRGVMRRIVLPESGRDFSYSAKGGKVTGDLVILATDLEGMVLASSLEKKTLEKFVKWLKGNPAAQRISGGDSSFKSEQLDALVRAGFLTAVNDGVGRLTGVYARPEDRSSMLSLEVVSRAAAGSFAAVGGDNALHDAGGTGGARSMNDKGGCSGPSGTFCVAVPGAGLFLKLVSGALERIEELLQRAQDREMPVDDLREKWDGGIPGDRAAALAKKARGEFVGIMPARTKKWKDFHGLSFDWILQEAVGAGLVEVFETGSVGLGVRLLT
ncbi:serine-threonine protein kinase 19-domain-containing protein [Rhypophila decipiens]|uniref:Serine-threonine protein kinase 19-domain-containing protein n=1 Tax=Rhypophila decipiens TaxID=261697 RepID=A0AAN6YE61_9PEZI|nr:serine-threonine protein kinase 19-domain-containing protein [Rhypophila decipiens]